MSLNQNQNNIRRTLSKAQALAKRNEQLIEELKKKYDETLEELKDQILEEYGLEDIGIDFLDSLFKINEYELDFDGLNNILTED